MAHMLHTDVHDLSQPEPPGGFCRRFAARISEAVTVLLLAVLLYLAWFGCTWLRGAHAYDLPAGAVIKTICAGGSCDYTNVSAWLGSWPDDMVSAMESPVGQLKSGTFVMESVSTPGHYGDGKASATYHPTLMAFPGDEYNLAGSTGALIYGQDGTNDEPLIVLCDFMDIVGIGFTFPNGSGDYVGGSFASGHGVGSQTTGVRFLGCSAFDIHNDAGGVSGIQNNADSGLVSGCIAINIYSTGSGPAAGVIIDGDNSAAENILCDQISTNGSLPTAISRGIHVSGSGCTVYNGTCTGSQVGVLAYISEVHLINVIAQGNSLADIYPAGGGSATQDHCAIGVDVAFVDADNGDYYLAAGDTVAKDQGVAVSGRTTDLDGVSVPQGSAPDIGCFELIQSAALPAFKCFIGASF